MRFDLKTLILTTFYFKKQIKIMAILKQNITK